ncbi:MAG TPA: hypothetical protein ENI23_07860 [bacterium]|nr:hypothetical protein [bacterium]
MIDKQREKEFLFELERLYHNYNLVVTIDYCGDIILEDANILDDVDKTTRYIEACVDEIRIETLEDMR